MLTPYLWWRTHMKAENVNPINNLQTTFLRATGHWGFKPKLLVVQNFFQNDGRTENLIFNVHCMQVPIT